MRSNGDDWPCSPRATDITAGGKLTSNAPGRTIGEVVRHAAQQLEVAGVPSPFHDAKALVLYALGWETAAFLTRRGQTLDDESLRDITQLVTQRAARVPLQHLLGRVAFCHIEIRIREGVFIPRPETEVLVGEALASLPLAQATQSPLVVEPCTGSGVIAAAIADERRDVRVIATDLDAAAVALARENTHAVQDRVTVLHGDLMDPIDPGLKGRVDLLVANPPYLAESELEGLEPEVLSGDPLLALVSGPTGHEVSDRLIVAATAWLRPGGALLMELDARRTDEVATRCRKAGLAHVRILKDLTATPRIVRAACPQ